MSLDNSTLLQRKNTLTSKWDIVFDEAPKEWIGFKPALGDHIYTCYACRHMFSCLRSLQDHVNRRIIVIQYNCSGCLNQILTFYNRCSFLLHTRKHYSLNQGKINLCEIDIFTLPVSLAGFLPHPNIPILYATEEETIPENVYINTQFYSPDISERGKQIITLKPNDIVFRQAEKSLALKQICANIPKCEFVTLEYQEVFRQQNLLTEENNNTNNNLETVDIKQEPPEEEPVQPVIMPVISKVESVREKKFRLPRCLDCKTFQKDTMAEHYLGTNKPFDSSLKCSICKFIAATSCSLKAHIRIHENVPPFVCPDCGKDFPTWAMLRKHMDDVCFHLAKHVRFRCPGKRCGKLFAVSATFALHFQTHLKCYFACSICGTTVFKAEDAEAHKRSHEEFCTLNKIYECPLCPHIGTLTEDSYKAHVNIHATDIKRCMYVYMCKHCRSYFRSTTTYATHLLKCSSKQTVHVRKYDVPRYVTRECEKCTNKIIFNEQKPTKFCNKCRQQNESPKPVLSKRYFCILCNKQILPQEKSYHRKQCKYGRPYIVIQKLTMEDVENLTLSSSGSDFDSSSTPRSGKSNRRRSSDSWKTDDSTKKKRKRTYNPSVTKQRKTEKEVELDLTAEEPMQFDGTYRCKLCDYENIDRAEFHAHVKRHRDISTAYQCMECAECFVVKPSLIKHLLHFHNISDHESYLKENDCFDVDAVKELESVMRLAPGESKEPVKENQCRVCRQEFKDALSLNKHFRIHGMAFLLRNSK
ncbi:zinc finger protein 699-like [Anoplophora glabripennis]|uniref:zinc finger protein 699-like n=1 Tax=Anoplophora glabripennis TaxID=217634 RepID=UPI0008757C64|nr:zinc finger protein 699-like [Anoplophora glabripennis]